MNKTLLKLNGIDGGAVENVQFSDGRLQQKEEAMFK
tara:strand:+ start:227 stop:334 length:108 start_codon:yes stop_codon:yes gene_type:complete